VIQSSRSFLSCNDVHPTIDKLGADREHDHKLENCTKKKRSTGNKEHWTKDENEHWCKDEDNFHIQLELKTPNVNPRMIRKNATQGGV